MTNRLVWILGINLTALLAAACAEKPAKQEAVGPASGSSLSRAAAAGTTVSAIVELSDLYRAPETYDVRITVKEIARGEAAREIWAKGGAPTTPAKRGFQHLLVRIRFEFAARGAPGDKSWLLDPKQFSAYSGSGRPYDASSVPPPEPRLGGTLRAGESLEGWTAFEVAEDDAEPVMTFSPGGVWFRLY